MKRPLVSETDVDNNIAAGIKKYNLSPREVNVETDGFAEIALRSVNATRMILVEKMEAKNNVQNKMQEEPETVMEVHDKLASYKEDSDIVENVERDLADMYEEYGVVAGEAQAKLLVEEDVAAINAVIHGQSKSK